LPKSVTDILKEMLDISLILNVVFLVLFVGNVFTCTGYFIPFTYLVDQAEILGIHGSHGAFLISIMHLSQTDAFFSGSDTPGTADMLILYLREEWNE
jgi:hypothetical protein